ncbi:hypothetical protein MCA1719 [Methylococcus capsulatus str. Bath]|uniref:Uncharacterized protein n=1 Tax=Methylococcus capsulatus (strain ATCC 33009 / NCIMB 11132 / Bath) TaxID=243233 RepID=Q607P0_METCA|nr:hypothetical protein MCA1719 [Methylococcus capsulatus str. Bath]
MKESIFSLGSSRLLSGGGRTGHAHHDRTSAGGILARHAVERKPNLAFQEPETVCPLIQADAIHGMTGTSPFTPPDRARFSAERTGSPLDLDRRVDADRPRSGIGRGGAVGGTPAEARRDPNVPIRDPSRPLSGAAASGRFRLQRRDPPPRQVRLRRPAPDRPARSRRRIRCGPSAGQAPPGRDRVAGTAAAGSLIASQGAAADSRFWPNLPARRGVSCRSGGSPDRGSLSLKKPRAQKPAFRNGAGDPVVP